MNIVLLAFTCADTPMSMLLLPGDGQLERVTLAPGCTMRFDFQVG